MNIQRFILPAAIAASFHAALFWALPREEFIRLIPVVLGPVDPPPPPPQEDPPTIPPAEKASDTEPFRQITGGPNPPVIPEEILRPKPDGPIIIVEPRPPGPVEITKVNPEKFGPGGDGPIGVTGPVIISTGELDRVPDAKLQLPPEYPFALKQAGAEGSVTVEFDVDRSGQVTGARVRESTHGEFEPATLRAVLKWRFEPGRRNGRAVPFRMTVPVHFRLG